jgi:hypothetical protein
MWEEEANGSNVYYLDSDFVLISASLRAAVHSFDQFTRR